MEIALRSKNQEDLGHKKFFYLYFRILYQIHSSALSSESYQMSILRPL